MGHRPRYRDLEGLPERYRAWLKVAEDFGLGPAHVKMLIELGVPPKFVRALAGHPEQTGGRSLTDYIEHRYRKKLGKEPPSRLPELETVLVGEGEGKLKRRRRRAGRA